MINFTVTPSFEPKRGKYMAYNKNEEIVIVDTSNWNVKKKLSDDHVGIHALKSTSISGIIFVVDSIC